ncbi:MAG TPA: BamA/TamA family outer membrane protein [Polyangiaceae bacterium]|nr:BamA/TamA family outer membrane protein [Polyangiaceae bacterium]
MTRPLRAGILVFALATSARGESEPPPQRTELGAVPLVGGDSDVGFGGGALGSLTHFEPRHRPYFWRLELYGVATFKRTPDEGWRVPYQDYYLVWTDPHVIRNVLRLDLRPSYTNETTQLYYGIGNATAAPARGPAGESATNYFQYGRMHPTLLARLRVTMGSGFYALTGAALTFNRIDVHPGSQLERDARAGGTRMANSFRALDEHAVAIFEYAVIYDTRDDETAPHGGAYHQLKLRLSPGGSAPFPYRYGQLNATTRVYFTPIPRRLTIAARLVGDVQFGDPPFYELARHEDTFAIGGVRGVRGVPAQRYYGKLKAFGNLEMRSSLLSLRIGTKDYALGVAAFFDAGRMWADWRYDPARDGVGLGLKWGVGGGLRFQQGSAFVVRADVAWSPDATPIAAYFTAGQIF